MHRAVEIGMGQVALELGRRISASPAVLLSGRGLEERARFGLASHACAVEIAGLVE